MDIWVVSMFCLLEIVVLWIFAFTFLFGHFFSVLLSIYFSVELLRHIVNSMLNLLRNFQTIFFFHTSFSKYFLNIFRCDFSGSVTVLKLFDFFVLFLQFICEFLGNSNIKVTCMYVANMYFFLAFINLSLYT